MREQHSKQRSANIEQLVTLQQRDRVQGQTVERLERQLEEERQRVGAYQNEVKLQCSDKRVNCWHVAWLGVVFSWLVFP